MYMKNRRRPMPAKSQAGYAFLVVMFMTTLLLLGAIAATPYVRTESQREKEQEMIWRGKQYVRGIKLYYRKMGRFPTSMDDLTKPKAGSIRFMRQAYKDPMNKSDGTWRFIYVGPSGQLIGSLKPPQTLQMPGGGGGFGTPAAASAQKATSFGASGFGQSSSSPTTSQQAPGANPAGNATQPGSQQGTPTATPADDAATAAPSGLLADSPVIGGNIIGVGSKINKRSVIVYDKAKNYRLFEFVWNPSKDMANALNQQLGAPNANQQGIGTGQSPVLQPNAAPPNNGPTTPPTEMPLPTPPPEPPNPPNPPE
jgi:hypothetical protein